MKAYSSMPSSEFIFQLRTAAIRGRAGPLIIDAIDRLRENEDGTDRIIELEAEVEALEAEVEDLKEQVNELSKS